MNGDHGDHRRRQNAIGAGIDSSFVPLPAAPADVADSAPPPPPPFFFPPYPPAYAEPAPARPYYSGPHIILIDHHRAPRSRHALPIVVYGNGES